MLGLVINNLISEKSILGGHQVIWRLFLLCPLFGGYLEVISIILREVPLYYVCRSDRV